MELTSNQSSGTSIKRKRASRSQRQRRWRTIMIVTVTIVATLIMMIPIYWMVNAAIRPIREVLTVPPKFIPETVTFDYIKAVLESPRNQQHFRNSFIITISALSLTLFFSTLAAYGFSRFKIPGGRAILLGMLALLMIPRVSLIIPFFKLANLTKLYDTRLILVFTNTTFALPMSTWLLKGYIDSISQELEEAAMIDGCNRITAIRKILLPIIFPGLVGVGTMVVINSWNDYLLSFILTQTLKAQPITIALAKFFGEYNRNWNGIMSLALISSLPIMLLYVFFQKYVIQGLTSGAVK